MQTKCSKAVSVHKEFLLCKFLFQIFKRKTDWVLSNFPNVSWSMKYREQKIFYSLLINSNRFHLRGSVIFNLSKNLISKEFERIFSKKTVFICKNFFQVLFFLVLFINTGKIYWQHILYTFSEILEVKCMTFLKSTLNCVTFLHFISAKKIEIT